RDQAVSGPDQIARVRGQTAGPWPADTRPRPAETRPRPADTRPRPAETRPRPGGRLAPARRRGTAAGSAEGRRNPAEATCRTAAAQHAQPATPQQDCADLGGHLAWPRHDVSPAVPEGDRSVDRASIVPVGREPPVLGRMGGGAVDFDDDQVLLV